MSLCAAIAIPAGLLVLASFFNAAHPAFDTISHFRLHLAAVLAAVALPMIFASGWRIFGAAGLAAAVLATTLTLGLPWLQLSIRPAGAETSSPGDAHYRLLQLNLRFDNSEPEKVLALIERERPDIVTFQEVSRTWQPKLEQLDETYPHQIICQTRAHIGGVAIFSRRPFTGAAPVCRDRGALAIATINFNGKPIQLVAAHLGWPWPYDQAHQVDAIEGEFAKLGPDAMLAGDFNATPWSHSVYRLTQAAGVGSAGLVGPTWLRPALPASLRPLIGLPLDHIHVKGKVQPLGIERMEMAGSDHLPVMMEFSLLR